ncbi:hypothetical protein LC653_28945 [Nostoc sp. CHAB 5784]|nr:hypothetical protein [Nostoc mirabile CHAB5784]
MLIQQYYIKQWQEASDAEGGLRLRCLVRELIQAIAIAPSPPTVAPS